MERMTLGTLTQRGGTEGYSLACQVYRSAGASGNECHSLPAGTGPGPAPLEKRRKLDAAKAAGKATQSLEDKIYEIEDAIRLATRPA